MSFWTYIRGAITVHPMGRTQSEKRYILETVLAHLPRVTGSEGDMSVYVIQKEGHDTWCSADEFGNRTNNLIDNYGLKSEDGGMEIQSEYILVVDGALRDRVFETTKHEFINWICRLAKRMTVCNIMVSVSGWDNSMLLLDEKPFRAMFEPPSWCNDSDEPNWCEYLMWGSGKEYRYPVMLMYKYYADEKNDAEAERRMRYEHSL